MELYRDIAVLGVQGKATIRPGHAHDTAWQGHNTIGLHARCAAARAGAWPGQGACHNTNFVSWLGAAFVSQYGCDTGCDMATVRHDTALGPATRAATRNTARTHGLGVGCVAIQPATRPPMPATRPKGGRNTAGPGLRHDVVCVHCARKLG